MSAAQSHHGRSIIAALTGIRAFAALWVVIFHLRIGPARTLVLPESLDLFCRSGYLGVDLFGLLSGFVIAHNYAERLSRRDFARTRRYLWLRAVRIVPLHWFALALLVAGRVGVDGFEHGFEYLYQASGFFEQLFLVHGFGFSRLGWNQPSWTVSSEWLCYLLFPLLAPVLVRVRSGSSAVALAIATLSATCLAMQLTGHADFDAAADWGILRILGEFVTGCLLQRAFESGFARAAPWGAIGPLSLFGVAVGLAFGSAAAIVVCFALLVYALAHQSGGFARLLSTRPLVFLGEASYAIYILHYVVLRFFAHAFRGAGIPDEATILTRLATELAVILAAAFAAHIAIENPLRWRLRHWVAPVRDVA